MVVFVNVPIFSFSVSLFFPFFQVSFFLFHNSKEFGDVKGLMTEALLFFFLKRVMVFLLLSFFSLLLLLLLSYIGKEYTWLAG